MSFNEFEVLDEKVLDSLNSIQYNVKLIDDEYYFFISIDDMKLTGCHIKQLLLSDLKSLNEYDLQILRYVSQKLTDYQVYVKILCDFEIYYENLLKSDKKFIFLGEEVNLSNEVYKLELSFQLFNDEIFLEIPNLEAIIISKNESFCVIKDMIYRLSRSVPQTFYEKISYGRANFSIDEFLRLKCEDFFVNSLVPENNGPFILKFDRSLSNLSMDNIDTKIPDLVLEIDKTDHFIVLELKYDINGERFNITDYKYADTKNWLNQKEVIKIVNQGGKFIKYISDVDLDEDIFEKIFENTHIFYKRYSKTPFRVLLPLFQLNNLVNKVIPNAEKFLKVDYKNGKVIQLKDGDLKFEVVTDINKSKKIFSFRVRFKIGDEIIDLETIEKLLKRPTKYVQLKNGKTINVKNIREITKWIQFLKEFEFLRGNNSFKGDVSSALQMRKFIEDSPNTNIIPSNDYAQFIREYEGKEPLFKNLNIPEGILSRLRNYQKVGVNWLYFIKRYNFGGILADEMGLGKTVQALTFLNGIKGKHIVITPKSLIYNWVSEIEKFFPNMKMIVLDGPLRKRERIINSLNDSDYKILITSYSLLQKDFSKLRNFQFDCMILDEAHYVKNIKTLSAHAVRSLSVETKILLTGTPLENNLDELYNAFDLMMPGYLGSKSDFSRNYISKIERNNTIALEILHSKIRPFILRRTKNLVLDDLPEKQEQILYSEMTVRQSMIYNKVLKEVRNELDKSVREVGFERSRMKILLALLRLRQVCNHPGLLDEVFLDTKEISGKFEQFKLILDEVLDRNGRVLIFSQFTKMLDIIEKYFYEENISFLRLDGKTKNRTELVNRFNQDNSIKVFLISLKAGGVGLNLTGADTVFLYDPWWNPMIEKQAEDRAHRIGQDKTVYVYKFITKNSIEEKILKLQEVKRNLFNNLIIEDKNLIKKLSWEDLMDLFE